VTILFWLLALVSGYGFTALIKPLNTNLIQASPSSPTFMLAAMLIVTAIFQARSNLERGWPKSAAFVFGPPNATILFDVAAFFAGCYAALGRIS
jgi:hypothetical protein